MLGRCPFHLSCTTKSHMKYPRNPSLRKMTPYHKIHRMRDDYSTENGCFGFRECYAVAEAKPVQCRLIRPLVPANRTSKQSVNLVRGYTEKGHITSGYLGFPWPMLCTAERTHVNWAHQYNLYSTSGLIASRKAWQLGCSTGKSSSQAQVISEPLNLPKYVMQHCNYICSPGGGSAAAMPAAKINTSVK